MKYFIKNNVNILKIKSNQNKTLTLTKKLRKYIWFKINNQKQ